MIQQKKYHFFNNCVNWRQSDVESEGGLIDLIDSRKTITRATFLAKIHKEELQSIEADLGYAQHHTQGLTMTKDWHVEYFRSTHHGERVYGFRHSAIEYVFTAAS